MPVLKQISVFAQNKQGKLEDITKVFADNKINILAINIASSGEFGVLRFICDKPDVAMKGLKNAGLIASLNEVLAIEMVDKPGGLFEIAKMLRKNNINIENAYVFIEDHRKKACLIVDVTDVEKARKSLEKK
jgi:hypothetical protein